MESLAKLEKITTDFLSKLLQTFGTKCFSFEKLVRKGQQLARRYVANE
jgi:hypothetical protein